MRRVYFIWLVGRVRSSHFVRVTALLTFILFGGVYVSYASVWHNVNQLSWSINSIGSYFVSALTKTEFTVKTLIALGGMLLVLLLWDIGRFAGRLAFRFIFSRRSDFIGSS